MPFTMIVESRPTSSNKPPHRNYMATLRRHAQQRFVGQPMLTGDLYARIIWFYERGTARSHTDVDNISKWVLDALIGIVYTDDIFIVKLAVEKANKLMRDRIDRITIDRRDHLYLDALLQNPHVPHVLYVEVGQITNRRIVFGAIDGVT